MNWVPLNGKFEFSGSKVTFEGAPTPWKDEQGQERIGYSFGLASCSSRFTGGEIQARIRFEEVDESNSCELLFQHDLGSGVRLSAGIGSPGMFVVRSWDGKKYTALAWSGDRQNLKAGVDYVLRVQVQGTRVRLFVDDVEVVSTVLPDSVRPSQPGLFCIDKKRIEVDEYSVLSRKGRVFAVMQLSSPYREIYEDVIKRICEGDYEIRNAEEIYGPGLIMSDVAKDIIESDFVVADITPANPNVYYELGAAHALGKPVIMVADRANVSKLPFDIAAGRVVFYENTIAGKRLFEEGFRKSVAALEQRKGVSAM